MKRQIPVFLALFFSSFLLQSQDGFDCFSVIAGKDATADGSVLFAHNEDDWGDRLVNWYQVPGSSHQPGEMIRLKNGGTMEQAMMAYIDLRRSEGKRPFIDGPHFELR